MTDVPAFDDEDIPADIWETAESMALESSAHPFMWSLGESIARAIYIERERCARIADAHSECERDCGDVIAEAIRRGPA